ncbi:FV3 31KDa-like protein [Infectious spleen and kidney necrosis virus]|uniref:ORF118L n=4 Tax=Infectious spleen and kidney necrosis virus TaxID=180170 RepID=Q8QUJ2_ISKNN|nr:ORF118L [Infectious spleen and kidney necrosis virus]QIQ54558.1 FV3 31KDa-like protein [Angelfish iridovirus AFIV-16]QOE77252.1 hypothetical protein [Banggai cardinalfish iridovirus]QYK20640.1 early 31kDa-protein [Spotted knifejaw iridovirus]WEP24653.1 ORF114L [Largemouth bass ulcerative syndrome virus]AAL98842.1 ORF118L [Infectious spleen and kidney necrosis virus]
MAFATTMRVNDVQMDKVEFSMGKYNEAHNAHRIMIKYDKGPLVVKTNVLFSYGIQENTKDGKLVGYSLPLLCDEPLSTFVNQLEAKCREYIVGINRVLNKKPDYAQGLDTLYYKRVEGMVDPASKPKLYARVNTCFKDCSKITSHIMIANRFEGQAVMLPKTQPYPTGPMNCITGLQFDNIYCGTKPSMQVKAKWIIVGEQHEEACAPMEELSQATLEDLFGQV